MRPSVEVPLEHSSVLVPFGFAQDNHYHHEDSKGRQHFSRPEHSIVIMAHQSSKPDLSVRTHELVSMTRPRREDASLNSHPQLSLLGHQTLSHFEMARLEKDRRDWRELATFLRTNDPPSSNFMSDTSDKSFNGKHKKHAGSLNVFRRTAAKKSPSKAVKPLQLPDSAVAARTTKGHWHIAISIPISAISTFADDAHQTTLPQNKVLEEEDRAATPVSQPPAYRPGSAQNARCGNISPTPSQNSVHPVLRKEQNLHKVVSERNCNDALSGEAATMMKSYYQRERVVSDEAAPCPGTQAVDEILSFSKGGSQSSPTSPDATSPSRKPGTNRPVHANENGVERNHSHCIDPSHSTCSTNSEEAHDTMGHSRGTSGASTSTQMPETIAPPPRSSSWQTRHLEEGNREVTSSASTTRNVQRTESERRRMVSHKNVGSGDAASSIAMVAATEGLQHQLASMRHAPRTPAPTRALPDLPEVSDDICPCLNHHRRSVSEGSKRVAANAKQQIKERQEKVKALRMRDIAAQKAKQRRRSTHQPVNVSTGCSPGCQHARSQEEVRPSTPQKNSMRSARHAASVPFTNATARAANASITLSPVRTIASTSPSVAQARQSMYSCATPTSTTQSLPDDFLDSLLPSYDYHRLSSTAGQRQTNLSNVTNISSQPMTKVREGSARSGRSDGDRTIHTLTPPRSLSPSFASSDEDGVHIPRSSHSTTSRHTSHRLSTQSQVLRTPSNTSKRRNSYISQRRQESKDSEKEDVKEIKERIKRMEKDNERIMKTLQAMVHMQQGVKDLCDLLSPSRPSTSGTVRPMTAGGAAARRVSRTLGPAPLSLRGSPWESARSDDDDMARRMRDLEIVMASASLGHGGFGLGGDEAKRASSGWEELSAVEPLMREVRMNARVSHESLRATSDEEEAEDGLGYSLMEQGC